LRGDLAAGYRVQRLNVERWEAEGRHIRGRKIATTSSVVQEQFGIGHPTSGVLFDDMIKESRARIITSEHPQPRVEAELAFVIGDHFVNEPSDWQSVLACIEYISPAIEVVSCRITNWDVTAFDFVADNAAAGLVVLGADKLDAHGRDWTTFTVSMDINGKRRVSCDQDNCAERPLDALRWLAMDLAARHERLHPGDVVMSGSLGPAVPVGVGDKVQVCLDRQNHVEAYFV
jgi:2-keto-4-pentenoate hydratase